MNYNIHPQIREALKRAERINVRGEASIILALIGNSHASSYMDSILLYLLQRTYCH